MKTSTLPPASIWRASTELAANELLTGTLEVFVHAVDSSPTTLVNEAAAKTRTSGFFDSPARARPVVMAVSTPAASNHRGISFMVRSQPRLHALVTRAGTNR